jgi:hypothetical protein
MKHLYQILAAEVDFWRKAGYPHAAFPLIAEILEYQTDLEGGELRFLRKPQMRALETYWFLRLVEGTPRIRDLYSRFHKRKLYAKKRDLVIGLGIPDEAYNEVDNELDDLFARIEEDDDFARRHKLETVRETLTLAYPSFILALAMGAGKTVLIGAIVATEFAMALEYPKASYPEANFVENALVFAPGKTILGSLRELSDMPYEELLPLRLYNQFAPNLKLTFTRDGEKDVPVIRGSRFNVVVTNTEKIRIQKETIKKSDFAGLFAGLKGKDDEVKTEVANLRLQTIASLPHLAVFSDEAHHTYGQELGKGLKQVRKTVDYLAERTSLVCVVNTTGTPFFERQPLRDVVIWYGLAEGIADKILKEVKDGIQSYEFDDRDAGQFVGAVVRDFFADYANVRLSNGAPAKLAIYFPQTADLEELRPVVEQTLIEAGQDPAIILRNTSASGKDELDAFERLNDPGSPHRVILLVNKGTEGWNCPSLFACALARKLKTSANFVLQAATRCLRQVPGNDRGARIYLSVNNRATLDNQLRETYGEDLGSLTRTRREKESVLLTLRKFDVAPLVVTVPVTTVRRKPSRQPAMFGLRLVRPQAPASPDLTVSVYNLRPDAAGKTMLQRQGLAQAVATPADTIDLYSAATELAARYRLDPLAVYNALSDLYDCGEVPTDDLDRAGDLALARQLERECCDWEQTTALVEMTLALVKAAGWRGPDGTHTATATAPTDEELLVQLRGIEENPGDFGYHYAPYKFDSKPERDFFLALLDHLRRHPDGVEDVYFTGGTTDEKKTDFFVEYTDSDGKYHRYVPDFVIRRKPVAGGEPGSGPCLIVEIKSSQNKSAIAGELAGGGEVAARTGEARKAFATLRWVEANRRGGGEPLDYTIVFDDARPLLSAEVQQFIGGVRP